MKPFKHASRYLALGLASLTFLSTNAVAQVEGGGEDFSYTYIQLGAGFVDTANGADSDLIDGRVVVGLGKYLYLRGEGAEAEFSTMNTTSTSYRGSIGFRGDLSESIDYFFDVGYANTTTETGSLENDFDGPSVGLGLRGASPGGLFEAEAFYSHRWFDDLNGKTADGGNFRFEVIWRATDHFGLFAGGNWETAHSGNNDGAYAFGLRAWL